jgi:hypothetical protein
MLFSFIRFVPGIHPTGPFYLEYHTPRRPPSVIHFSNLRLPLLIVRLIRVFISHTSILLHMSSIAHIRVWITCNITYHTNNNIEFVLINSISITPTFLYHCICIFNHVTYIAYFNIFSYSLLVLITMYTFCQF